MSDTAVDSTLTPDATSIADAMRAMTHLLESMESYVSAVGSIQTEPQPFNSGGISGTADPFAQLPDFKNAVITAQSHAGAWSGVFVALGNWMQSVQGFSGGFSTYSQWILNTIAAVGTGTPTAAQRQDVTTNFGYISAGVSGLYDGCAAFQTALLQFVGWMRTDYATLTAGPNDVQAAIDKLEAWFTGYEEQLLTVGGGGIINVIAEVESLYVNPMKTVQTELQNASTATGAALSAASTLLNLTSDLRDKTKSVVTFITSSSDATLASAVQRLDLRAAEAAWSQLASFIGEIFQSLMPVSAVRREGAFRSFAGFGSTSGDNTTVTADPATTDHLTDATNALTLITAYTNALANTVLTPATTPPEAWFSTLSAALTLAQSHATTWVDTLGPKLSSGVPQTIIDYGNLFNAASQDIISVLQGSSYKPNAAQRQQILGDIATLQQFVTTQKVSVSDLQTQLKTFQDDVLKDHLALSMGASSAQKALMLDNDTIARIQAQIAVVQADLTAATQKATASEIGIGLSIFVGLIAIAVAVGTVGLAAPILLGAVAVIGLGASIATTVIFTKQQADDVAKLAMLNNELTADQAQAASLSLILTTTQTLIDANQQASAAMDKLVDVWADLLAKINSVQTDLSNADKAADAATFGAFAVKLWTNDAVTAWGQLVTFCTNMQTALLNTTVTMMQTPQAA